MRRRHFVATALFLSLSACGAADDGDPLPGDVDDSPEGGGKADAWNGENDPDNLATHLNYRLKDLPLIGKVEKPVWNKRYAVKDTDVPMWSDTYWPTVEGSANARFLGANTPSPLEKYDAAFHAAEGCAKQPTARCGSGAMEKWDEYLECAGPAAAWHTENFQDSRQMYDGEDSDGDGKVDECGDDFDGLEGWWGLCHAWSPASLLEPEPQKTITYRGVEFTPGDIKALLQVVYDDNDAMMLGGRCNAKRFKRDRYGRVDDLDCRDTNAGAWHVIMTNFIGIGDAPLVMDRTANVEVWNQPIYSYEITLQDKITERRGNECVGASGSSYKLNDKAKALYEVKMTVGYLVEGEAQAEPMGLDGYIDEQTYHYVVEVDGRGKVIGGEWCKKSATHHPDFLWAPQSVSQSTIGRNPEVDLDNVYKLLAKSRE
jgi:Transglutaminase elicitor